MKCLNSLKDHDNFTDSKNQESGNEGGGAGKIKQVIEENQTVISKDQNVISHHRKTTEENPTSIPSMDNQHRKSQLKTQQILYREGSGREEPTESCDPEKYISYI